MIKTVTRFWSAFVALLLLAGVIVAVPAQAIESLTCVDYVKQASSVHLSGNAHRWWDGAAGRYARGARPAPGAVMVFSRTGSMPYGHVAIVRSVQGSRSILVDHANWSVINGRRGQIEQAVSVVDVSAANDWSRVRVWYDSVDSLGSSTYGIRGFVYAPGRAPTDRGPQAVPARGRMTAALPVRKTPAKVVIEEEDDDEDEDEAPSKAPVKAGKPAVAPAAGKVPPHAVPVPGRKPARPEQAAHPLKGKKEQQAVRVDTKTHKLAQAPQKKPAAAQQQARSSKKQTEARASVPVKKMPVKAQTAARKSAVKNQQADAGRHPRA